MKELLIGLIGKTVLAISSALAVWMLASWADVAIHNVNSYSYASWNLFMLLLK